MRITKARMEETKDKVGVHDEAHKIGQVFEWGYAMYKTTHGAEEPNTCTPMERHQHNKKVIP